MQILKIDEEKRLVTGWAMVANDENGNPVLDSDDDIVPLDELRKGVYELITSRPGENLGGVMHTEMEQGDLVDSFVMTLALIKKLAEKPREGWLITFRVNDDSAWERVKNGELREFSIRGDAEREPI